MPAGEWLANCGWPPLNSRQPHVLGARPARSTPLPHRRGCGRRLGHAHSRTSLPVPKLPLPTLRAMPRQLLMARGAHAYDNRSPIGAGDALGPVEPNVASSNPVALVLTGVRLGELVSIRVCDLDLDAPRTTLRLDARHEENREGSMIALRAGLAAELREWVVATSGAPDRRCRPTRTAAGNRGPSCGSP